ncbi:MAG: sulfotransferase [Sandaracinaceae bacterium]|nr:sulfotransferase [Sandaracinaceae bacterium]
MSAARLVLVGEQRSGTTLLARMLDAQPGVRVRVAALTFALRFAADRGLAPRAPLGALAREALARELTRGLAAAGVGARLAPADFATFAEAAQRAIDAIGADGSGDRARVAGSKEHAPAAMIAPLLRDAGVHVLYLVRDPRDVVRSRARRGEGELARKLVSWRESVGAALALDHPRLCVVRYEDLARDPAGAFARIEAAFGWGLDPVLAAAWRPLAGQPTNTSFGVELDAVDARPVERWREAPREPWVRFAGAYCAPELARLGYAPGPPLAAWEARSHRALGAAVAWRRRAGALLRHLRAR